LVMNFPFAASTRGLPVDLHAEVNPKPQLSFTEPPECRSNVLETDDRTKRRRLDPQGNSVPGASGMKNLEFIDGRPSIRIGTSGNKQNVGGAAIQALLRTTLRHIDHIESLYEENNMLVSQTSALEEARMRSSRLILAAEQKLEELQAQIKALKRVGNELIERIGTLGAPCTERIPSKQANNEKYKQLAVRLGVVEKRGETQLRDTEQAKLLQERSSGLLLALSDTSEHNRQAIEEVKQSAERSRKWRKYLDEVIKEQKIRIDQLESEQQRQKEGKKIFEMATERRIDDVIKRQQENSHAMMKRLSALEKIVEMQSARAHR
jgi:hypothetical protein